MSESIMNSYKSSIYTDIQSIELLINYIDKISKEYKEYYIRTLEQFRNNIILNDELQILYKNNFSKINTSLILFVEKYVFKIIKYVDNLFNKYNISKKIILFDTFSFSHKEYNWIADFNNLTVNYIVFEINMILNYFLEKIIVYKNTEMNRNFSVDSSLFSGEYRNES